MHPKGEYALKLYRYFRIFENVPDIGPDATPDQIKEMKRAHRHDYGSAKSPTRTEKGIRWKWGQDNFNICVATGVGGDVIVLDYDMKPGQQGAETLARHERELGLPQSYRVKTPSGGIHVYLRLPKNIYVGNSSAGLGPNCDVRGNAVQAYVFGEGSTIAGKPYVGVGTPEDIEPCPPAILEILETHAKSEIEQIRKSRVPACELDTPHILAKATEWLKDDAPDAIQNMGGDTTTFCVAAVLFDSGVSEDRALDLMERVWNHHPHDGGHADPPWLHDELEAKVRNAYAYAHNQPGERAPVDPLDEFGPVDIETSSRRIVATPAMRIAPGDIPPRQWVIGSLALRGKVSIIIAAGGTGKSSLSLKAAIAVATGNSKILGMPVHEKTAVWVWNQEDDIDELNRRTAAAMIDAEMTWSDIPRDSLYLSSGVDLKTPIVFARRTKDGRLRGTTDVRDVIAEIREKNIGLVVLDPLQEIHEGDENNNTEMKFVFELARRVANGTNAAVIIAAHSRKPSGSSSAGFAGDPDSLRGASSQTGVARIVSTLVDMCEDDAKKYGIKEDQRHRYVRLDLAKANMALKGGPPNWFYRTSVKLTPTDTETVGTLTPVYLAEARKEKDDPSFLEAMALAIHVSDMQNQWVSVGDVLAFLPAPYREHLEDQKNRARKVHAALRDAKVDLDQGLETRKTTKGDLEIKSEKPPRGAVFRLNSLSFLE